jgi:hypothetical protein
VEGNDGPAIREEAGGTQNVIKIFTPGPAKKQLPSVGLREYGASSENLQARARVQFASAAINGKTQQTRCPLENPQSKPWSSTTSVNELDVLTCESLGKLHQEVPKYGDAIYIPDVSVSTIVSLHFRRFTVDFYCALCR